MDNSEDSAESESIAFDLADAPAAPERRPITIWVSAADKAKFDRIQERSRRKFTAFLRSQIIESIDKTFKKLGQN